jgi:hypothetical protein
MSMVFLANVQSIVAANVVSFYTPHEHVTVDYPRGGQPDYIVSSYYHSDIRRTNDFATAMDLAARWLKQAEPA